MLRYQPHIDGLRAVAVMLVILHHLGDWAGLRGGYVGVDVFFVISGFLITGIVKAELEAGNFSFGSFYKRRVIRLAPAYFAVLLATTIAALVWMLPAELMAYARSMGASSVFMANFHMWKEIGGYFGADAETAPLLHLWSLAVEEQFYLFWPVALLLAHRTFGLRALPWMVAAVMIGGVIISQWGVLRFPAAAYYLLPTRFFELAVGALLAYIPAARSSRPGATFISAVGIAMVTYAAMSFGKKTLFPGYGALIPVVGTALVLRWGAIGPIGSLLSSRPAVLVGKISYPAYLWHWPIIVFLHVKDVTLTTSIGFGVIATTFGLSWLTYRVLELPARRFLSRSPTRVVASGALLPIGASVAFALALVSLQGLPARFPDSLNRKSEALFSYPSKARGRCNEAPPTKPLPPDQCVLGRAGGKVNFLLVGDSHANHFSGFFDVLGQAAEMRGYDMTRSNTPFFPGLDLAIPNEPGYNDAFRPRNEFVSKLLVAEKYDAIVLAGAYTNFFEHEILRHLGAAGPMVFEIGFRAALREASASAPLVIVMTQVPSLPAGLADCSLRTERFHLPLECRLPAKSHRDQIKGLREIYKRLSAEFPRVVWINLDELMCDRQWCMTEMDGLLLYRDDGHLNDIGARHLARKWLQKVGNPLMPSD